MRHIGAQAKPDLERLARLTRRELEVLTLVATGIRNRNIAEKLFISEKTVRNHVSNVMRKTGMRDRTQLALWALKSGLSEDSG